MFSFYKKFFQKNKKRFSVTFATSVFEGDWKKILQSPHYLKENQIAHHLFDFQEKILIVNNVVDYPKVLAAAKKQPTLTKICIAKDFEKEILSFFMLTKEDFKVDSNKYPHLPKDWVYYNALAPLCAIYCCETDYLLYMTGDSYLKKGVNWIEKAICLMEKNPQFKVANLAWNDNYKEVKKESYKTKKDFYIAKSGFSDQMFLVKTEDFKQPIYHEIRKDSHHFPRGDVFEKRVFSYLKNRGFQRLIYRCGSYTHENIGQ